MSGNYNQRRYGRFTRRYRRKCLRRLIEINLYKPEDCDMKKARIIRHLDTPPLEINQ